MSLLCRFGWHDWTKWRALAVNVVNDITGSIAVTERWQRRECLACGMLEDRRP